MLPDFLAPHGKLLEAGGISLAALFAVPATRAKERLIRTYLAPLSLYLPTRLRYYVTGLVKKRRNPSGGLKLNYPLDSNETAPAFRRIKELGLKPWWGRKGAVCISHDVDNDEGFDFVPAMAALDGKYGLRTTFNFLTHDQYRVGGDLTEGLVRDGFEVGLHGYTHDQGFAFRSKAEITNKLSVSAAALGLKDAGYRSPALSLSEDLFKALGEQQFLYDSSLQIASPFYWSVKLPYPCYLPKYGLWELPLMVQDDTYFRDSHSTPQEALASIGRLLDQTADINGVFVINMHPHLIRSRVQFYEDFLKLIASRTDVAVRTSKEVIEYAKSHTHHG